ncbi:unnamed protein product [Amoebophrya sp. A25]|nr:unnamed protein product [Amoebophrya sp. A25]|eukprot:GSA25T00017107001.1
MIVLSTYKKTMSKMQRADMNLDPTLALATVVCASHGCCTISIRVYKGMRDFFELDPERPETKNFYEKMENVGS